jgi:hypothetical protein
MLKHLVVALAAIATMTVSAFAAGSGSDINLLLSTNATWAPDVAHGTLTVAPRNSGDSLVATWTMDSGSSATNWVVLTGTLTAAKKLNAMDSIKLIYRNDFTSGFSLRVTQNDGSIFQAPEWLNGTVGLQGWTFILDSAHFPQVTWQTPVRPFRVDRIKSVSLVCNANPPTLTKAGALGIFRVFTLVAKAKSNASVNPFHVVSDVTPNALRISSDGFSAPRAGRYTVAVYSASGELVRNAMRNYSAGFNAVDFSDLGSGMYVVNVAGSGITASRNLIIGK